MADSGWIAVAAAAVGGGLTGAIALSSGTTANTDSATKSASTKAITRYRTNSATRVGGVFLAFSAILLASLTLVVKEESANGRPATTRGAIFGTLA